MRKVADYLIGLGHRDIGVLCMRLGRDRMDGVVSQERLKSPHFHVQRERIEGVRDAMVAGRHGPHSHSP